MSVKSYVFSGCIVEEEVEVTLSELSQACGVNAEWLMALVAEGIIEPVGEAERHCRFGGGSVRRARIVQRLQRDLGVNMAGAALALELLEEIDSLRTRLAVLESYDSERSG